MLLLNLELHNTLPCAHALGVCKAYLSVRHASHLTSESLLEHGWSRYVLLNCPMHLLLVPSNQRKGCSTAYVNAWVRSLAVVLVHRLKCENLLLTWKRIHMHLGNPFIAGTAGRIPAIKDPMVAVSCMDHDISNTILHRAILRPPYLPACMHTMC